MPLPNDVTRCLGGIPVIGGGLASPCVRRSDCSRYLERASAAWTPWTEYACRTPSFECQIKPGVDIDAVHTREVVVTESSHGRAPARLQLAEAKAER